MFYLPVCESEIIIIISLSLSSSHVLLKNQDPHGGWFPPRELDFTLRKKNNSVDLPAWLHPLIDAMNVCMPRWPSRCMSSPVVVDLVRWPLWAGRSALGHDGGEDAGGEQVRSGEHQGRIGGGREEPGGERRALLHGDLRPGLHERQDGLRDRHQGDLQQRQQEGLELWFLQGRVDPQQGQPHRRRQRRRRRSQPGFEQIFLLLASPSLSLFFLFLVFFFSFLYLWFRCSPDIQ